ncbi:helix-turn-helix DNA binding domain protein [Mycobacterium phage Sham4]|uniref:HTH DNA binding protein n=1 Tax=Mycobacterium phage Mulciber TaxID=1805459 RepID=UPI00078DD8A2|nr:HTH DNA binding protein [Mycobacterium phage Mulciber]AQT28199.1 HTH DNA binding protein [Mycobacterium phage Jabith]AXH50727.1 helix-turn-helix DNA-binding domain protein [Mycobacterium phage Snape]QBI97879.1 helix-turn-helix DNA-binding domain protein [Mycobacterium phage Orange]QBI98513.1 helix-turn-helix DNA-binding domain protein [Mycobacterium phage Bud]QBP32520.1 helix-turn-helix DNA-binding domain protein [Mycobacterium phage Fibonacci]QFG05026.1 helix-turn-helix DNA-binding domain
MTDVQYASVEQVVGEIERMLKLKDHQIQALKTINIALKERNEALHQQVEVARRSFGEAFLTDKKGPRRPNRPKLTDNEVADIRAAHRGGMKQRDLAANYGVNPATISRIVRGVYH